MLDSKLTALKHRFGIINAADWRSVEPAWILALDGYGHKTLNYLRVLLAGHDVTLKNDQTPEYWRKHLPDVQIVQAVGDEELGQDRGVLCPFTVLIDTAETLPFTFQGLRADSDEDYRPLIVPTEQRGLGRHPDGLGDYSLSSGYGRCHVERKSMEDMQGTLLGFKSGRRERFERELANLAAMPAGLVVVECSFEDLLANAPNTDHREKQANAKILSRSVLALQQDYPGCSWMFASTRRLAEIYCFRWLFRFHEKQMEAAKQQHKRIKRLAAPMQPVPTAVLSESLQELF